MRAAGRVAGHLVPLTLQCLDPTPLPPRESTMSAPITVSAVLPPGAQELVAARMPQRIVDLLELVEVDEMNGKRTAAAQVGHGCVHMVAQ